MPLARHLDADRRFVVHLDLAQGAERIHRVREQRQHAGGLDGITGFLQLLHDLLRDFLVHAVDCNFSFLTVVDGNGIGFLAVELQVYDLLEFPVETGGDLLREGRAA